MRLFGQVPVKLLVRLAMTSPSTRIMLLPTIVELLRTSAPPATGPATVTSLVSCSAPPVSSANSGWYGLNTYSALISRALDSPAFRPGAHPIE